MSLNRTKTDLIENFDEISQYVHKSHDAVFISDEEGRTDVVILSNERYEQLVGKAAMQELLASIDPNEKHPCVDVLAELNNLD